MEENPQIKNTLREQYRTDPNVLELKALVNTPDFQTNFLAVQTKTERTPFSNLLPKRNTKRNKDPVSRKKLEEAQNTFEEAVRIKIQDLHKLKEELKHPNAKLIEALSAWGRSRNARGETGPEQKGFNAGVIHYFEYRTNLRKNKRFKPENTLSVEAFIVHTKQYVSFLKNPSPANNAQIKTARLVEDSKGNRRLYILTREGDFIVGFQRFGEEMKILSVFLEQNEERLNRTADEAIYPTTISENRFNLLFPPVKEIQL